MELQTKIIAGLERIGDVFKTLLWQKAKVHGISPIQIQILLFVASHNSALCNVSYLAKEFNVTKPTISDAVKVLLKKDFVGKDNSPLDSRRYNLVLSPAGKQLVEELLDYTIPVATTLENINEQELKSFFATLTKIIYELNKKAIIQVQRTCFGCRFYEGNQQDEHYCKLLSQKLKMQDIRLDCLEFEEKGVI